MVDNYASSQRHPIQAAHESQPSEKRMTKPTKPMVRVRKHENRGKNGLSKSDGSQRKPKFMISNDSDIQKVSSDSNKQQQRDHPLLGHVKSAQAKQRLFFSLSLTPSIFCLFLCVCRRFPARPLCLLVAVLLYLGRWFLVFDAAFFLALSLLLIIFTACLRVSFFFLWLSFFLGLLFDCCCYPW